MEVVDKNNEVIKTAKKTVSHDEFLNIIKPFKEIRAGIGGGKEPFKCVYLKVTKKEVIGIVEMERMEVTYSIMYNSKVDKKMYDILYVEKMRMTLLDDENLK